MLSMRGRDLDDVREYVRPKGKRPNHFLESLPQNPIRALRYRYCACLEDLPIHMDRRRHYLYKAHLPAYVRYQSAAEFAKELGVGKNAILHAEQGVSPPSSEMLLKLYNTVTEKEFLSVVEYYARNICRQV